MKKGLVTGGPSKLNGNLNTLVLRGTASRVIDSGALPLGRVVPGGSRPQGAFSRGSLTRLTRDVGRRNILRPLLIEPLPTNKCRLITNRHH